MRLALLTVLAVFAAGCMTAEEEPSAPLPNASDPALEPAAVDPALVAAAEAASGAAQEAPFAYSGTTPEGVCGPFGCRYTTPGAEDFHPLAYTGRAVKIVAEVTYAEVKPGMEFYIGLCTGAGESEEDVSCGQYTTGASPLLVEFDLADVPPGEPIALSAGALNGASTATGVMVFTASSFDVAGTMTLLPG